MRKILTVIFGTAAYWVTLMFSSGLVILWNNFLYWFTGVGYAKGSFMYDVLMYIRFPISYFIAYAAIRAICKEEHRYTPLVNCALGAALSLVLCLLTVGGDVSTTIQWAISAVAGITCLIIHVKEFF